MISIVDDDLSARAGIADLVMSMGFDAKAFERAEDFLKSAHLDRTDCLITDMRMPGMTGFRIVRPASHVKDRDPDDCDHRLSARG